MLNLTKVNPLIFMNEMSNDLIKYDYYGKDVPDERCIIIILAMLAHHLLF
jgi:hypothetical protein